MKGSSFVVWFLISAIIPVLGLIAAIVYRSERDEMRRICPGCGTVVKLHDAVCTRCGAELEFPDELIAPQSSVGPARSRPARARRVSED